jgi:hypothetical protein
LTGCYQIPNFSTSLQRSQEILSPDLCNNVTTTINDKTGSLSLVYYIIGGLGVVCLVTFIYRLIQHHLNIAKTSQATNQD